MDPKKYLACVETDEETGDVTVHILNESKTKELNAGAAYVTGLLDEETARAHAAHILADIENS